MPLPLGGRAILHVIPFPSFVGRRDIDVVQAIAEGTLTPVPLGGIGGANQVSVNLGGFVNYVPDGGSGASSYVQLLLKRLYGAVRSGWIFNGHSCWAGPDYAERMVAAYLGRRGTRL